MSIHFLCPIRIELTSLIDDGFSVGLAFAAGFSEAFSSSWIGMASPTNLSIPFTIRIQDTVWPWNKDWTWTSILYLPLWLQRGQIVHCLGSTLQYEFLPDLEASYILGIKIDFLLLSVTEEHRRIVQFRLFPNLLRSIVWITSGLLTTFSNRCAHSCSKFPCRSSLACICARGGCVRISTLSSWPGALGFPTALWPTVNSSIISVTAP